MLCFKLSLMITRMAAAAAATATACRHGNQHLIIFLLIFSISALTHFSSLAQGREMPQKSEEDRPQRRNVGNYVVRMRSLIGSRPPRCEGRCRNCGHCEAVQVPIVPILKHHQTDRSHELNDSAERVVATDSLVNQNNAAEVPKNVANTRGDYLSNYKPMCWKCKCGNLIFNP